MTPPDVAAIFAVVLVVGVAGFIVLSSYNAVVALRQRIDKAWSNIGVVLRQRHDQLPNLVSAVRGLMTYERDVLTRVTEARAAYAPDAPIPDQAETSRRWAGDAVEGDRPAFAGDPAELRDRIAEAAGLGFDMIQLRFAGLMDTTDIELFADQVLPHVR